MRSPFLMGLVHPLNIAMLGIALFAGLVAAWWLFPIGLLLWLIMVIAIARDPSLRFNYEMQSRAPLAQRFQRYFDRIERAQLSVFNSLSSAPANTRRVLQPIRGELDALTAQAYSLCQRMTTLENYRLVSTSQSDLESDLAHINEVIEQTEDPLIRREYQESRVSFQERLDKLKQVSIQLERVEAQLLSLANDMDSIVTEVIRLQAIGSRDASRHVPKLVKKLRAQATELRAFEREAARM